MNVLPKVLIVGRPNVGKSSFANRLAQKKEAITAEVAGVTRDLKEFEVEWTGHKFCLIDSGGMVLEKDAIDIQHKIDEQVASVLEDVALILFMVDVRAGLNPIDENIAKLLRPFSKKIIVVVNKVDTVEHREDRYIFSKLGLGDLFCVSAAQGLGVGDLLDHIVSKTHQIEHKEEPFEESLLDKITVIGRPNIGKSSLMNHWANKKRVLVYNQPGTTRDTIYEPIQLQGESLMMVDTAGLRKRTKVVDDIEYYSRLRTDRAIDEADVIVFMLDMTELMTELDKKLFQQLRDLGKNIVFFINKCDLLDEDDLDQKTELAYLQQRVPQLNFYPIVFGSVLEKKGLLALERCVLQILERRGKMPSTGVLNRLMAKIVDKTPPPAKQGKRLNMFYVTIVNRKPISMLIFVNEPKLVIMRYERFIEKQLREEIPDFFGLGLRLVFKKRSQNKKDL